MEKISGGVEWFRKMAFPVRRVWTGVVSHLRIHKPGIRNLQHDVRACEYEDVQIMWEMLQRNEIDQSPVKRRKDRLFWRFFVLCRTF